jgi:DNA-binding response OmpR family regulator
MDWPPKRVLIVEDWPNARKTLRWLLEKWGYVVQEAEDGLHGVQQALSWRPDIAIVDIGLPNLDGYEVARQVREVLQQSVYLIAMTAYEAPEYVCRAEELGFDRYLVKPADLDELQKMLAHSGTCSPR